MFKKNIGFIGLAVTLFCSNVHAQNWEAVDDSQTLKSLFSDAVIVTTLKDGVKAEARYNRDGTGELRAWGDTFPRTWEVRGKDQVCIGISNDTICYKVERNADTQRQYRAKDLSTGEIFELTIESGSTKRVIDHSSKDSGGVAQPSAEEIAAELANPNSPLATLTFKVQYRTYDGDLPNAGEQNNTSLVFQPSFPFAQDNGDVIFFRPAIPFQTGQPVFNTSRLDFDSESGIGDISFDLAYGRTTESGILFAGGMVASIPTATYDGLGNERWSLGPEFLIGKLTKKYVLGAYPTHLWDVGGWSNADVNLTSSQFFATYLPGGGWSMGLSPTISFNHVTDEWTIPLNFNVGKTIIAGGRPWKLSMEVNYYVEKPGSFGPEWLIGFNVAPIVKNIFAGLFK